MQKLSGPEVKSLFNRHFPVGSKVKWRSIGKDGVPYEEVTVRVEAWLEHGVPVAMFEERRGYCSVDPAFVAYP